MSQRYKFGSAQPLDKTHDRNAFDCGVESLNQYLKRYALQNQRRDAARTYVILSDEGRIAGFYTLVFGSVAVGETTADVASGLGKYPVPIMLVARLAVDVREKGKGYGTALLRDALLRTMRASEIAGLRAVLVHAKDDAAKEFYERFGFKPSPHNDYHLFLNMSDLRISLSGLD